MKKVVSPLIFIVLLASITPTVLYPMMTKSQTECNASDKKHNHSHHKHSDHNHSGHDH